MPVTDHRGTHVDLGSGVTGLQGEGAFDRGNFKLGVFRQNFGRNVGQTAERELGRSGSW